MSTTPKAREARRRRIMEKGSDRLALITGRSQNLEPLSPSPLRPLHSHTASCPPSMSLFHDYDYDQSDVLYEFEDKSTSSLLPKASGNEHGETNAYNSGTRAPSLLRKCETTTEALRASSLENDDRVESSMVSSTVQTSLTSLSDWGKIFTPHQICSAIAVTKSKRIYCSLAAAVLVVLSYIGFPILGSSIIRGILFFRPLYLLLLTNISIVIVQLLLGNQRGSERSKHEENNTSSVGEDVFADQLGKTLEMGFLLQNIIGAVFMDCSVYAVVIVSGFSLAQKLGW